MGKKYLYSVSNKTKKNAHQEHEKHEENEEHEAFKKQAINY
jgi:hypothetical protein